MTEKPGSARLTPRSVIAMLTNTADVFTIVTHIARRSEAKNRRLVHRRNEVSKVLDVLDEISYDGYLLIRRERDRTSANETVERCSKRSITVVANFTKLTMIAVCVVFAVLQNSNITAHFIF